ncbi:hypothetical protein OO012_16820 [Rhodobacteraceae bacterium KMM 6894]|nr:hypothetical protein [Rhodobacteraceae bacterium KMM 6894]
MQKIKMIALGCGTLALALGAGHFMQSGADVTPFAETPPATSTTVQGANTNGALELSAITLTSALPSATLQPGPLVQPPALVTPAALDTTATAEVPGEEPAPAFGCDYTLTADPAPGAMALLSLDVPCMPGERFTLHHNGLMFTEMTDEGGHASMLVPAMATQAVFIVSFPNGEGAVANTTVDSMEFYDRVAVQWQGDAGVHLHALEFGAEFGSDGHVWSGAPRDVSDAADGDRGFMTRLGNPALPEALVAEVYTFPSQMIGPAGTVSLSVEAEVTAANCARDIDAQSLQVRTGGGLKVQDVLLAMPDCDASGDFLVLKNLLNDLTIARN